MSSWYEKCMPKIKEIKPHISKLLSSFKNTQGVKSLYVWGSYAKNIDKPDYRIRDIDILARTQFHSGDLIAIDDKIVGERCSDKYLENQGFDPLAIKFSKRFLGLTKYNIDIWAISSDRKLLHWGPVSFNKNESKETNKEAEDYAIRLTGLCRQKINKSSEKNRRNWFNCYHSYVKKYFENMPTGWYKTDDIKIKNIISNSIKI